MLCLGFPSRFVQLPKNHATGSTVRLTSRVENVEQVVSLFDHLVWLSTLPTERYDHVTQTFDAVASQNMWPSRSVSFATHGLCLFGRDS